MTSYFNVKKLRRQSKQATSPEVASPTSPSAEAPISPVLDEQDEQFLERLAAIAQSPDSTPPALPERRTVILDNGEKAKGKDAQEAIVNGADNVPLPMSPPEIVVSDKEGKGKEEKEEEAKKKSIMSYFALAQSKFKSAKESSKEKGKEKEKEKDKSKKKEKSEKKDKEKAAKDLHAAAESAKDTEEKESKKEEQDISEILDQLNLSAVNNRVFSFSKESTELLDKFKLVLKDVVNGAPTAYHDLEKLLTDSDAQLKKMYGNLPPFLQNLVKSLPTKITAALGPEILAAQAEKPGFDAQQQAAAQAASSSGGFKTKAAKKLKKSKVPSLKQLISAEGAVATMLKSILNFLKLRFPALMTGTNLLMSLAVFILLFVFWYCHKRGRETRLEAERLAAAEEGEAGSAGTSLSSLSRGSSFDGKPEKADPPLIISDGKEPPDERVKDMPSVHDLPSPMSEPLPNSGEVMPLKEEPLPNK